MRFFVSTIVVLFGIACTRQSSTNTKTPAEGSRVYSVTPESKTAYQSRILGRPQLPLRPVAVPFAKYLNTIHGALHPHFSHEFLGSLSTPPRSIRALVEIVIDGETGALVQAGVIRASGDPSFDAGVLRAIDETFPVAPVPEEIRSVDGMVYLVWDFWDKPEYACSTYFVRPYRLADKPLLSTVVSDGQMSDRETSQALPAEEFSPLVREQVTVVVDGQVETWKLIWTSAPQPVCDTPEFTCPCIGFQYGESAELELVRIRPGHPDDRLALTSFFAESENHSPLMKPGAVLPKWPLLSTDFELEPDSAEIASRPLVQIMNIADYNHDGLSAEFVLQIGVEPCGHSDTILVGLSRANPNLHVFGTAQTPDSPLRTERAVWEQLRSKGAAHRTILKCGDHGSETTIDVDLRTDSAGLHLTETEYECENGSRRGRRIAP